MSNFEKILEWDLGAGGWEVTDEAQAKNPDPIPHSPFPISHFPLPHSPLPGTEKTVTFSTIPIEFTGNP
jgi:hypothetical protein